MNKLKSLQKNFFTNKRFKEITGKEPSLFQKIILRKAKKKISKKFKKLQKRIDNYTSSECDLMVFKNGDELEAKVIEMTSTGIKYRKCNISEGPIYTKEKSEIFMIKYKNGTKEMISSEANPVVTNVVDKGINPYQEEEEKYTGAIIAGVLSGLFLFLVGALLCFSFPKGPKRKAFFTDWSGVISVILFLWAIFYV